MQNESRGTNTAEQITWRLVQAVDAHGAPDQMLGSPTRERWELVSAKRFLPRRADHGVVTGVPARGSCKLVCKGFGVLQFSDIIIPK